MIASVGFSIGYRYGAGMYKCDDHMTKHYRSTIVGLVQAGPVGEVSSASDHSGRKEGGTQLQPIVPTCM